MFNKFDLDIADNSRSCIVMNTEISSKLALSVTSYGEFFCQSGYFTRRSGFPMHLLLYTVDGEGVLLYHDQEFHLQANSVMLINCKDWQEYRTARDSWHFFYVHYNGTLADDMLNLLTHQENFRLSVQDSAALLRKLNAFFSLPSMMLPKDSLSASQTLNDILLQLLSEQESGEIQITEQMERALEHISSHYSESLSLDELCKLSYLSKFHFLRQFHKYTGSTPGEYIRNYRISQAQILLKNTACSVEEISHRVGYDSTASFIRAFRDKNALTPHQYRNS